MPLRRLAPMTSAETPTPGEYADPPLECDIVLKGGITSGIVYPKAIRRLAKSYQFRNIGGTSAGAIAAGVAAAAELGRQTGNSGSFESLAAIPDEVAQPAPGSRTRLLSLFRPDPETRRLFDVVSTHLDKGAGVAYLTLVTRFRRFPLAAVVLAASAVLLAALSTLSWIAATAVCAIATVLFLAGPFVEMARAITTDLPRNGFGLGRLGPAEGGGSTALTEWLHQKIQHLAGRSTDDPPVTFADLWLARSGNDSGDALHVAEALAKAAQDPNLRKINLEVMTTDLTHGRARRLPALPDPHDHHPPADDDDDDDADDDAFLLDLREFGRYFPQSVVQELAKLPPLPVETQFDHAHHYRFFPWGAHLPIVVAVRMSLSFPLLISAVPLRRRVGNDTRPVWFSDGGMTSNFPLHFFDQILPSRPTFAINLVGSPETPDAKKFAYPVDVRPRSIESLGSFLTAIKDATQNWRDNAHAELPGFRERMVGIRIGHGEGGLNLGMAEPLIRELAARGDDAAATLGGIFVNNGEFTDDWRYHRFARLRVAMAVIEVFLEQFADRYRLASPASSPPFSELFRDGLGTKEYAFPSEEAVELAELLVRNLLETADRFNPQHTLNDDKVPTPHPDLRVVPPV